MTVSGYTRLLTLQAEDCFVFHGSGLLLEVLEPRQAYTVVDGQSIKDGPPAIWASHLVDYAFFMALINRQNCPISARSSCHYTGDKLTFGATQDTLDQLSADACGYVHVFDRKNFELRGGSEWMCLKHLTPIEVVVVNRREFALPIEVIQPQIS